MVASQFVTSAAETNENPSSDWKRNKDIPARVAALEYDPNRTAHLAPPLVQTVKRYILAPKVCVSAM